eukprot:scaffold4744_cov426-Prasinococcus_capsulatus_cf.AAC.10
MSSNIKSFAEACSCIHGPQTVRQRMKVAEREHCRSLPRALFRLARSCTVSGCTERRQKVPPFRARAGSQSDSGSCTPSTLSRLSCEDAPCVQHRYHGVLSLAIRSERMSVDVRSRPEGPVFQVQHMICRTGVDWKMALDPRAGNSAAIVRHNDRGNVYYVRMSSRSVA